MKRASGTCKNYRGNLHTTIAERLTANAHAAAQAQREADADIAEKLYGIFGKRHDMRRAGEKISQAIRTAHLVTEEEKR